MTVGVQLDFWDIHTKPKMSQPETKKARECTQHLYNVFDTIDSNTGKYFSLGIYPHLPHTPTPDPTEHVCHASHDSGLSLAVTAAGSDSAKAPHVPQTHDVEHAGLEAIAQAAAGGGSTAAAVNHAVGGGEQFPEYDEELVLGEWHSRVDRKGEDKGLILEDSNEESPVTEDQAIDPSAPVQGNQPRGAPGAGGTKGKWTKSR